MMSTTSDAFLSVNYPTARLVRRKSIAETYESVSKNECDIVLTTIGTWEMNSRSKKYNANCELEWVGRVVQFNAAGYALGDSERMCSSLLRDVIDLHMIEMKSDGIFDQIWLDYREEGTTSTCLEEKNTKKVEQPLKLTHIGGLFICYACALVIVVIFTMFRLYWSTDHANVQTTFQNITTTLRDGKRLENRQSRLSLSQQNNETNQIQTVLLKDILMKLQSIEQSKISECKCVKE